MCPKILWISMLPTGFEVDPNDHNYNKLLVSYLPKEIYTPGLYHCDIQHDNCCRIYRRGRCNCKPNITIERQDTHEAVFALRWRT